MLRVNSKAMVFEGPHVYAGGWHRRRHTRVPLGARVILSMGKGAGTGWAVNVSEGGMCVRTPTAARSGQQVWLLLEIDGEALEGHAEVVHGDEHSSYGLKFTHLEPAAVQVIRRYVASRTDSPAGELLN